MLQEVTHQLTTFGLFYCYDGQGVMGFSMLNLFVALFPCFYFMLLTCDKDDSWS
jgi:hypothetical protein